MPGFPAEVEGPDSSAMGSAAYQRLLSDLGHDLRTPLTVVRGAATLLLQSSHQIAPERQAEMLELIDRAAETMSDRIEDMLTLAALEGASLRLNPEPVDIAKTLERASAWARRRLEGRSLSMGGDLDGTIALADADRSVQVLRCLLEHAIRATPTGSALEITARKEALTVRLTVRGPDPPADGLFEAPPGGAGGLQGLQLARALARAMDGDVRLEESPGAGPAFSFTLKRGD